MTYDRVLNHDDVDKMQIRPIGIEDLSYLMEWIKDFNCSSVYEKEVSLGVIEAFYRVVFESSCSSSFFVCVDSVVPCMLIDVCRADMDFPAPIPQIEANDISINIMLSSHYLNYNASLLTLLQKCLQYLVTVYQSKKILVPIYTSNSTICELLEKLGFKNGLVIDNGNFNEIYILLSNEFMPAVNS